MSSGFEYKSTNNPLEKDGMFNGANRMMFQLAKDLRKSMAHSEKLLWNYLKTGVAGCKFRRQHPIGIYIADFYCHKIELIVELDGSIHNNPKVKEQDIERENDLIAWGYKLRRVHE